MYYLFINVLIYLLVMTNENLQSKTISFLRFPLIVGVVLIHSRFNSIIINGVDLMTEGSFPIYTIVSRLFSDILPRIAVPLFFFISGFLFFYKVTCFTRQTYFQKLKKRARTILVPYIFWNLLVILLFFLSQTFLPGLISGKSKLICDYDVSDWLWAFWNINKNIIVLPIDANTGTDPICFQLWFIRDLMVVILFSPLVYWGVKKLRQYVVLILGILWLLGCSSSVVGLSITAFFFFSVGAYLSIYRKNFVVVMKPFLPVSTILYFVITVVELCFREETWCTYIHGIGILIGIVLVISLSSHFLENRKWHINSFLSDSSFFIYAYHAMPLVFVFKYFFKQVQPHTDGMVLVLYLLCPAITILIGLFLYYLLKRYLPTFTSIITGGRAGS